MVKRFDKILAIFMISLALFGYLYLLNQFGTLSKLIIESSILTKDSFYDENYDYREEDIYMFDGKEVSGSVVRSSSSLVSMAPVTVLLKNSVLAERDITEGLITEKGEGAYYNFGPLLEGEDSNTVITSNVQFEENSILTKIENTNKLRGEYLEIDGEIKVNINYRTEKLILESVGDTERYYTQVIEDKEGKAIGIVFTYIGNGAV